MKKYILLLAFMIVLFSVEGFAQCSMCSANAEMGSSNGNTQTQGINKAVLYLLSFPFALAGGVGVLWYTKFRTPKA